MFVFDQLKRSDRQVQLLSVCVLLGMAVLAGRLWYVQILSTKDFEQKMQRQTYRTVRVPAIRGKILDRNGWPLAENRPRYDLDVYLGELLSPFPKEVYPAIKAEYKRAHQLKGLNTNDLAVIERLKQQARYQMVSNITAQACSVLRQPGILSPAAFSYHVEKLPYVPFPIVTDLTPSQVALYSEKLAGESSIELFTQPVRSYPNGSAAAQLLGYVRSQDWQEEDEELPITFGPGKISYCVPFWKGTDGLERSYDANLRGKPGIQCVLINNYSYRQREEKEMEVSTEVGDDLYLTIDLRIQKAAEKALANAPGVPRPTRGAVVVMDVNNGDILALVSSPTFDPNIWTGRITEEENARFRDEKNKPLFNRTIGAYNPGSVFKIITAIACLESGVDTEEIYTSPGYFALSAQSRIGDTAAAGPYNFEKAFYKSSNSYFIYQAKNKVGLPKFLEVGRRFHFGETTQLAIGPESRGDFPKPEEAAAFWIDSDLAFAAIGQKITVTPVQIAGMISVIANGGKLYWPRVVSHLKSPESGQIEQINSPGRLRDTVVLNPKHLGILHHAMLMDTEHEGATAYNEFYDKSTHEPLSPILSAAHFRVAGKTGTAQLGNKKNHVVWFASFGPYEKPRYAVVVMVEADAGGSGGGTCAPVAREIYDALVKSEQAKPATVALAADNRN